MNIPFMNLSIPEKSDREEILSAIDKVLIHGRILLGPEVSEFEEALTSYCGTKYSVGISSGTDALHLALRSLDIGKGDEVIVPSLSWIATANAVAMTGATPIFADIENDLNISLESIQKLITKKTRAIVPVHFMGYCCDMVEIVELANRNNLLVIEDAAQAFGASVGEKRVGSMGHIGCFSMNPMKLLPALGEAGAIVTNNSEVSSRIKILRYAGMIDKIDCVEVSLNSKIDTLQAAVLNLRLRKLPAIIQKRREIASVFDSEFSDLGVLPSYEENSTKSGRHVYYGYTLLVNDRSKFIEKMSTAGIETKIQHSPLMPDQKPFGAQDKNNFENASYLVERIVNIPNHENLSEDEIEYIVKSVKRLI